MRGYSDCVKEGIVELKRVEPRFWNISDLQLIRLYREWAGARESEWLVFTDQGIKDFIEWSFERPFDRVQKQ